MFEIGGRLDIEEESFEFVFFGLDLVFADGLYERGVIFEWVMGLDDDAGGMGGSDGTRTWGKLIVIF